MRVSTIKRLLSYLREHKLLCILSLILALLNVALSLLIPYFTGKAVDMAVGVGKVDYLGLARQLTFIAVSAAAATFSGFGLNLVTAKISFRVATTLRSQCFDKIAAVPLSFTDTNPHGAIISNISNDTDAISTGLNQMLSQFVTALCTILGTIGFMFYVNAIIATAVVLITPLSIFVSYFISKKSRKAFLDQSKSKGELSTHINEMVSNQKLVAMFGHTKASLEKFEEINADLYISGQKSQFYSSLSNPCTRFVNSVVYACVGVFGAIFALSNTISIGSLVSFLQYANQYTKPFNEITSVVTEIQNSIACASRVFTLLDTPEEADDSALPALVCKTGSIKFSGVGFGYNPRKPLMNCINIDIKSGEHVAIVGKTGCGKTTLINLLMRFYDINKGEILVDGVNIFDVNKSSLRGNIGMVLQDSWIFRGSVKDNIAYSRPDASLEEIIQAAKWAGADEFISKTEKGYDTMISESAGNISQGQKQLLCIARIMLINPQILILDEATSNIDTRSEMKIQKAFSRIMDGKTSFIVAHRLSTIIGADKILVMSNGDIIEQGNHAELLASGGFYKELWESQFRATVEDLI